jgi:hypothetical protein
MGMKSLFSFLILSAASISAYCDFANYFEIKFNQQSIYHSTNSADHTLKMELDSLTDRDLFEIKYHECGMTAKNDYELHIKVENTTVDLTFINDAPEFILNMGWFTQFKNKKATIYLYQTKYTGSSKQELIHKIVDLLIS